MSFQNLVGKILSISQDVFGEEVIFTPQSSGTPFTISGIVDRYFLEQSEAIAPVQSATPLVAVKIEDVVDIAGVEPVLGDGISARGVSYVITEIEPDDRGDVKLILMEA